MAKKKPKRANSEGSGPYKRADGRWEARISVQTPAGKRRKSFYGATREQAADKMYEALPAARAGTLFNAGGTRGTPRQITVGEYLAHWLQDSARPSVAASTYSRYESAIRNHLIPALGHVRLADLTAAHIRHLKRTKLDEGLAPGTVGNLQALLSGALSVALSDGLIATNVCALVPRAKSRDAVQPMRALSREEASRLTAAARGTRDEALLTLAVRTGMRQGELAALRWEDVDLQAPSVTVRRSADTRTQPVVTATKTGEERTVKIGPSSAATLSRHKQRQAEERFAARVAGRIWEDRGLVFPNTRGRIRRRDSVMRSFRQILASPDADLPPTLRFHDLRHTAATLMLRDRVPLRTVADVLGHKDPAITLRRYAHVLSDMQDVAAAAMDDV